MPPLLSCECGSSARTPDSIVDDPRIPALRQARSKGARTNVPHSRWRTLVDRLTGADPLPEVGSRLDNASFHGRYLTRPLNAISCRMSLGSGCSRAPSVQGRSSVAGKTKCSPVPTLNSYQHIAMHRCNGVG